jgi:alpha-glucuronidase
MTKYYAVLKLAAFSNITFNPKLETELTREEWEALSVEEQNEIIQELIWEEIEAWVDFESRDDDD